MRPPGHCRRVKRYGCLQGFPKRDVSAAYQELADMVTDINRNVVSVEERLSDHVYLYERKEGVLRIVA